MSAAERGPCTVQRDISYGKTARKGAPDQQSGAPFLALTAIFFNISVLALDDDLDGFLAAEDVADDGLLALQALVDAEEVADFACHMVRQLRDVLIGVVGRILEGNGNDLFIETAAVLHRNNADGVALHEAQRADAFRAEHQNVQRVAVVRPGAGDEAVVGGIVSRGVENSVETQRAGLFIHLVLVFRALLDLDDREKVLGAHARWCNIMPKIHNSSPFVRNGIEKTRRSTLLRAFADENYLLSASSMLFAPSLPAPMARMTVAAPVTASPPA